MGDQVVLGAEKAKPSVSSIALDHFDYFFCLFDLSTTIGVLTSIGSLHLVLVPHVIV